MYLATPSNVILTILGNKEGLHEKVATKEEGGLQNEKCRLVLELSHRTF